MLAKIASARIDGFMGRQIIVECDISNGLPGIKIVGLGSKSIDESRERIKAALRHSQLNLPPKKITLNLAPANTPKDGTHYDLPMAIAILVASGQIEMSKTQDVSFVGELGLDGRLRSSPGIINLAHGAKKAGKKCVIVPEQNISEALLVKEIDVIPAKTLVDVYRHLIGEVLLTPKTSTTSINTVRPEVDDHDFCYIYGNEQAKRALEVAASGGHNILMNGPPGTGKTMLARALRTILPDITEEELFEITALHSVANELSRGFDGKRPFRSPHHTASTVSLIGGGTIPRPGEVSLSSHGVLFLDELPEFPRHFIESLRQPLEDGYVTVVRSSGSVSFPAKFSLVATKNPCPCGYYGDQRRVCSCSAHEIVRYKKKISGPLMDRIDIVIDVPRSETKNIVNSSKITAERSSIIQKRVNQAREIQARRFGDRRTNSQIKNSEINQYCALDDKSQALATTALDKLDLSPRAFNRILKVARTIADLDRSKDISPNHLAESLQYRVPTV